MMCRRIVQTMLVVLACVLLSAAQTQPTGTILANEQHQIVLDKPAWFGNTLLPAGTYQVHSHGSGDMQQVHFTQEVTLTEVHPEYSTVVVFDEVGKSECKADALPKAAEVSAVQFVEQGGEMRIVSVSIEGQAHAHVL